MRCVRILGFYLLVSLMVGCAVFDNPKPYLHSKFKLGDKDVTLIVYPSLRTDGLSSWNNKKGTCLIVLRAYPKCLEHEKLHCLYGNWHTTTKPNGEYCN